MQPQIVTKLAFSLLGFSNYRRTPDAIPALWDQKGPTLSELPSVEPGVYYGALDHFDPADRTFEYIAAIPATPDAIVPEGMVRWEIPTQTYAVFDCTLATLKDTFHEAYENWFPTSGYQRPAGPEFERYDERFGEDDTKPLALWIPVTPWQP